MRTLIENTGESTRERAGENADIHFGSCDDVRVNCIPIAPGWKYAIRMYQPREEILDGSWMFPETRLAN